MIVMKKICILFLGLLLLGCSEDTKMNEVMKFSMVGDCLVDGPWEEPIPSAGDSEIP